MSTNHFSGDFPFEIASGVSQDPEFYPGTKATSLSQNTKENPRNAAFVRAAPDLRAGAGPEMWGASFQKSCLAPG